MDQFTAKHAAHITATLSCFDRVLFKGHLPLRWPEAMERLLARNGLLIKDFKPFVLKQSARTKDHALQLAQRAGRPYEHLMRCTRKEDHARAIAQRDGITQGLVCVLAAVESCQTFKLRYGKGRPRLVNAPGKCLCLYFYYVEPDFGLIHIRLPTWFPCTVQVCLNGHEWLARQMDRRGMKYEKLDNAFVSLKDPARTQRLAERFTRLNWRRILSGWARRVNPLLRDLLRHLDHYWVTDQAEFATDVMFASRTALEGLYGSLLRHATCCLGAEDVLTFLGRKLHGCFQGRMVSEYKTRWPGARIKHRMKDNWIKMYNKHGCVLRIETVINRPYEFRVWRRGIRRHNKVRGWFPMAKGVTNLYRYAEVSLTANRRYLDALAVVNDPTPTLQRWHTLARPLHANGRSYRGFNPAAREDLDLFTAVLRGEHAIKGFCNADIRRQLFSSFQSRAHLRQQGARVSRLLKRLHVRGLVARIPRSRRWRVTKIGQLAMTTALTKVLGNVAA